MTINTVRIFIREFIFGIFDMMVERKIYGVSVLASFIFAVVLMFHPELHNTLIGYVWDVYILVILFLRLFNVATITRMTKARGGKFK